MRNITTMILEIPKPNHCKTLYIDKIFTAMKKYSIHLLLALLSLSFTNHTLCQKRNIDTINGDYPVNPEVFDAGLLSDLIFQEINLKRMESGLSILDFDSTLYKAAYSQAQYMAKITRASDENKEDKDKSTTGDRVLYYGGTKNASELVYSSGIKRGRNVYTYEEVADKIVSRWFRSRSSKRIVKDPNFVYLAVATSLGERGKAYASAVFGDYTSLNPGAHLRTQLKVPYTKVPWWKFWLKLKPYDERVCQACERIDRIYRLHKGLYVEDGKIFYAYNDMREFKRMLRGKHDGLAVEIIQKAQFPCNKPNIIDYTQPNIGYLTKRIYNKKLSKKILKRAKKEFKEQAKRNNNKKAEFDEREFFEKNKFVVCLAEKMPKIPGQYDLNLVIIKDKRICKSIGRTYLEVGDVEISHNLNYIKDTVTYKTITPYHPEPDTTTLKFKVPFEKNKYEYDTTDIIPLVESLNEPDFFINKITINAYSSLEGTVEVNEMLQEKRALSIVEALKLGQDEERRDSIKTEISTDDGWILFKKDIEGTGFDTLAKMEKEAAKGYILKNHLLDTLEPILAKHRYASIDMQIVYDISGEKEQNYVRSRFQKALKEKKPMSYVMGIQNYIIKNVDKGNYSPSILKKMFIPKKPKYTTMLLNQLLYEQQFNPGTEFCQEIKKMQDVDSTNEFLEYNRLCCKVKYEQLGGRQEIKETQKAINNLYDTKVNKGSIDKLNLKYQFRIIEELDTLTQDEDNPAVLRATRKVRSILKIDDTDWKSALKLANTVIKQQKDYNYAVNILEPFIYKEVANAELLFTYISLCTFFPEKLYSDVFATAIKKAAKENPKRFCKLFEGNHFSVQVLENLKVKKVYCNTCEY